MKGKMKMKKMIIKRNRAKCLFCGDIIESKFRHDFVTCSCGKLSVDGGTAYLRRSFDDYSMVEDMSEVEYIEPEEEG